MFPSDLAGIRKAMCAFAAGFEPDVLTAAAADSVLADAAAIENMAATVKALAARRVADCGTWKRNGARSPADDLARRTGIAAGQAKSILNTAGRLDQQPDVSTAARAGQLSPQQAAAISDAAAANPSAAKGLVAKAATASLRELKDDCARTKAAADRNPKATHDRLHATRSCRQRKTSDGMGEIIYRSTLDEIAEAWSMIGGFTNVEFQKARKEGRREPFDTYAADGFLNMCRTAAAAAKRPSSPAGASGEVPSEGPGGCPADGPADGPGGCPADGPGDGSAGGPGGCPADGPAPVPEPEPKPKPIRPDKVIVRIDWDAFVRGYPTGDEVSEIPGIGPVPVHLVRDMAASGDPFLAVVVTRGVDVHTVAHIGRKPTAYQDTAMQWRDPYCTAEGCGCALGLERDHREEWAKTKITALTYLDRLCGYDHYLKTHHGWSLVNGKGKRPFVPPDDPRHPNNAGAKPDDGARAGPREGAA